MLRFVPSETYDIAHPADPEVVVSFRVMDTLEKLKFDEATRGKPASEIAVLLVKEQVKAWRGVGDKNGNEIPLTPENAIDALYSDQLAVSQMTKPTEAQLEAGMKPMPFKQSFFNYLIDEAKKRAIDAGKGSEPPQNA